MKLTYTDKQTGNIVETESVDVNVSAVKDQIIHEMVETANDINNYLADTSAPLDCYQEDIDWKLDQMIERVKRIMLIGK
jgi:hypothetical protein